MTTVEIAPLVRVREAAQILSVRPEMIYKMVADGELEAVKLGSGARPRIRIRAAALLALCRGDAD